MPDKYITLDNLETFKELLDSSSLIETTYQQLVTLRDNSMLVPGKLYRITDYAFVAPPVDEGYTPTYYSAEHNFDIIVMATSDNTLAEQAHAMPHANDTYFSNSNLKA